MSATLLPAPAAPPTGYFPRRFDRDEYWRMAELGFFDDQRVELLDGEIVQMAAQGYFHAIGVKLMETVLTREAGPGYTVLPQVTLDLSPVFQPDPDLVVVFGSLNSQRGRRAAPTTAELVVEVSESTVSYDRGKKSDRYAAAGIPEYWILNLVDATIEVHRGPTAAGYATKTVHGRGDAVAALMLPNVVVKVDEVLPY